MTLFGEACTKIHSKYSWYHKNTGKDNLYRTRVKLIKKLNFDFYKTAKRYHYYMSALLGNRYV